MLTKLIKEIYEEGNEPVISVNNIISKLNKVIIYGASEGGKFIFNYLKAQHIDTVAFIDSDIKKIGNYYLNKKVISIDESLNYNYPIIIASAWSKDISSTLKSHNIKKYYDFSRLSRPDWGGEKFFDLSFLKEKEKEINYIFKYIDDKTSYDNFCRLIKYRLTMDPSYYKETLEYKHYINNKVFPHGNILDIGAYDGDTTKFFLDFLKEKRISGNIYSFEPSKENFKILYDTFNKEKNVFLYNIAISDLNKDVFLITDKLKKDSFYIGEEGSEAIKTKSLDEIFHDTVINYIKIDIEGHENRAILGGKKVIKKYKPHLAISIYHNYNDFITIPLLILSIRNDYKFAIGHHGNGTLYETILYAQ